VLSDIVKRGSCRSFAVTQVMCSEQCLRLQPQADILEAHDIMKANVCENESSQKTKLLYLSGVLCRRAESAVLVRSREVKLVFLSTRFTQVKSQ
jgi:hypothetical protein